MGLLDTLTPGQQKLLAVGVPVAAGAALWAIHKKGSSGAGTTNPTTMPSTQVIGAGQLAEFEQGLTDAYNHLADTVMSLQLDPPDPAAAPPPAAPAPADAAVPVAPPPPPPVAQAAAAPSPTITNPGPVYNQQPAAGVPAPGEPAEWATGVPADWYTDIPKPLWW